jgi:pimeloyl-ACP methyl ester carboxylesterase
MKEKQIRFGDKKIFYDVQGEGPAIVLLHGFGEDNRVWNGIIHLFPDHKLIVPDLPGSGRSEMTVDMSMEGLADCVQAIIVHENAEIFYKERAPHSVIMIGHSMGGYITLAFAEKYSNLLRAFGLFHSSAFADNDEKIATRRKGIDFIRDHGADEFLKTATPNLFSEETKKARPQLVEQQVQASKGFSTEALIAYYEAMIKRPDRTHILKETKLPVLFILGRHDAAIPIEDGLKQCHLPALSKVLLLENSGHMGMLEEVEKSSETLVDFVQYVQQAH